MAAVPAAFLAVPSLSHLPARLVAGCATWVGIAALLELASGVGFVMSFALVFGDGLPPLGSLVAGLRALGASTVLPGGSLVGPAVAARSAANGERSLGQLARRGVAFLLLTTAPSVAALALAGISLGLGWPPGPHSSLLTLPAAGAALALLAIMWRLGRPSTSAAGSRHVRPQAPFVRRLSRVTNPLHDGTAQARRLVATRDWRLLGSVAYYVFDNAVLWAAFRAYGSRPAVGVVVMGYLVGSLGSAVPIPAGLGTVEGGLIGALVLYGAPLAPAAAAVLLYRGVSLGLSLLLGGCGWVVAAPSAASHRDHSALPRRITSGASIMRPRSPTSLLRPSPTGPTSE